MAEAPPPPGGRGRGGRGQRLLEQLRQRQARQIGGDEIEVHPPETQVHPPETQVLPPETQEATTPKPTQPEKEGGRGKILATIGRGGRGRGVVGTQQGTSPPSSPDSGASSSPTSSSEHPSPSGAVGSPPSEEMARMALEQRRFVPQQPDPILNKARGTDGQELKVSVNYVKVNIAEGRGVFQYHVYFEPNIESRQLRGKILWSPISTSIIGNVMQFTGMSLFLPRFFESDVIIDTYHPNDDSMPMKVTIHPVKETPFHELIPFYNTLLRKIMQSLKLVQIQRHFYNPLGRIDIPVHKLEVWPGYVTAIHELDGGLMLNCDASHRVLRTNTALDMLKEALETSRESGNSFRDLARKKLVGCVILTKYNNRPYRVDDVIFDQTPLSTFPTSDGGEITYMDYFKRSWEIDIQDRKQPLLLHRQKPRKGETESKIICLIPELSVMTGLTDDIRSDQRAMKDIASHARIKPEIREAKFVQFLENIRSCAEAMKILNDWGISLADHPLRTKARTMMQEKIMMASAKTFQVNPKAEWMREVTNNPIFHAVRIEKWLLIYSKRDSPRAEDFTKMVQQVNRPMGLQFNAPRLHEIATDRVEEYINAIRSQHQPDDQIIVCITPGMTQREDRYNGIKKLCCCDLSVPSQVIRSGNLTDLKIRSVCQRVVLQMNCKVGGSPWAIQIPFKSCMFVGIDVYHDPSRKGKSVVAVVASINKNVTKWYSRTYFQEPHQEIANVLESGIVSCLRKFFDINHEFPARIFIYRDGVSDGQLAFVREFEIVQIENAILDFSKKFADCKPTVSVIIVQKNINTKMLMKTNLSATSFDNPPPGSVLDHDITRKNYYDFFLVSQFVNQGTVTPTHYIVVYDRNDMAPDRMQKLAYKTTHLYYNWLGTIRVPAPCLYAHKAAYLIGQNVKRPPGEGLADLLYYL